MSELPERLRSRIEFGDCWTWTGYRHPRGYGRVRIGGRLMLAHRAVYELLVGPIPDGLEIDHLCRNPSCVNPEHLEPVTHSQNMRRAEYERSRRTHCPHGHAYDEANTEWQGRSRKCRTCRRDRARERMRRRRANT